MTIVEQIPEIVDRVRLGFEAGTLRTVESRVTQLRQLRRMLVEQEERFIEALAADLGKPAIEAYMADIVFTTNEIDHTLKHLSAWLKPEKVKVPINFKPGSASIIPEPSGDGVCHRPVELPGAVLLSPAESRPRRGQHRRAQAVRGHADRRRAARGARAQVPGRARVAVVTGGVEETGALLEERSTTSSTPATARSAGS